MKQIVLTFALAFILSSCSMGYYAYEAPVSISGRVNIAIQPSWGPAGYDYALFYYFPEFNFYYDVERAVFYYLNYGRWVSAKMLPRNRHFPADLHRYYKVVINNHNPWNYNRQHKNQYKHFKGVYNQPNLRDARGDMNYIYRNDPRTQPTRRIPHKSVTPPRNNSTQPSAPTPNRSGKIGNRPGGSTGQGVNKSTPNTPTRPTPSRPNSTQNNKKNFSKSSSSSSNQGGRSSSSQGSNSTGSRSTGSRGR